MKCQRSRIVVLSLVATASVLGSDAPAGQSPAGDQKTLVIVAEFTDQPSLCSVESIRGAMFGSNLSVDTLFRDNSSGKVSFSGDVVGPFLLGRASTDPCSLNGLAIAAESGATASGTDISSYSRRVYVMPPNACGAGGHGTVGGTPSQAWVFACDLPGVFAHNLGHNLGMTHASSATPLPNEEYGDPSDPMAFGSNRLPGFNAPHRHQLGWLGERTLREIAEDADVSIAPLGIDQATALAPQVLKIRKPDSSEYYYVSFRNQAGYDQYMDARFFDRVTVHRYKGDGSSTNTFLMANLGQGQSYTDSANGINVVFSGRTSSFATVGVRFSEATCVPAAPQLTVAPQAQTTAVGGTLSYSVSVKNYDSPGCAATTFGLLHAVPVGWSGTFSTTDVTLDPGATGQAILSVASTPDAAANDYSITLAVSSSATAAHSVSTAVTYTVAATEDTQSPSAPVRLTARVRTKQIELAWGASTDATRVAGYRVWRNGVVVGTASTTSWTDTTATAGVAYTYQLDAYDPAGNVSLPSNTATIVLTNRRTK